MHAVRLVKLKNDKNWIAAYSIDSGRFVGKQKTYSKIISNIESMYPEANISHDIFIIGLSEFPERINF